MVILWPIMHPSSFILYGLFKHSIGLDDFTFLTILFLIAKPTPEKQIFFSRTDVSPPPQKKSRNWVLLCQSHTYLGHLQLWMFLFPMILNIPKPKFKRNFLLLNLVV